MMIIERVQSLIHALEVKGSRWLNYAVLAAGVAGFAVWYDTHCYVGFSAPEAMDAAQVARHLAQGKGFTTDFIRPFSIHLLQKHNPAPPTADHPAANAMLDGNHPDLANAPLYPLLLAGLMKIHEPPWPIDLRKPFWADGGHYQRYKPEFAIAVFNQFLLLVSVCLTFLVARKILDAPAAWLAAALMLTSDVLWQLSVSGLPTLLMLVIFLGVIWCLVSFETLTQSPNPSENRRFLLVSIAGLLVGLGMLARYSFGWLILPVALYFIIFGGPRRTGFALTSLMVFGAAMLPWIIRNYWVSGTPFGTAGYAVIEGTFAFPGSRLMQSLNPDMAYAHRMTPYVLKLFGNLRSLFQNEIPRLGGGWMSVLFLAGLLLGLRNLVARRLRYFTIMCLGVSLVVSALGQTDWTLVSPDLNTENTLVLLTPLVVIFGVAFFLTLLDQMNLPLLEARYLVIALVVLLVRLQFAFALLPPRTSPVPYPPYYPPEIQKFSAWMQPTELIMSDIPWAVAWYGQRQCTWTTVNCQYEFVSLNDFVKHVNALYLSLLTLNGRLVTDCMQGTPDNWSNFAFKAAAYNQLPDKFPLHNAPEGTFFSGTVLADRQRW